MRERGCRRPGSPSCPVRPARWTAACRQLFAGSLAVFPGPTVANEELIAEGDKVAGRWTTRATHEGELWGIPPTGTRVAITSMDLNRIAGGTIAGRWREFDALGLMQQLGAIPVPGQPGA